MSKHKQSFLRKKQLPGKTTNKIRPVTSTPIDIINRISDVRGIELVDTHKFKKKKIAFECIKPLKSAYRILTTKYPSLSSMASDLHRPIASDRLFTEDFLKDQKFTPKPSQQEITQVTDIMATLTGFKPYRPLHYCDTRMTPWNLSSGVDLFTKEFDEMTKPARIYAAENNLNPQSKHAYINVFYNRTRVIIHQIKCGNKQVMDAVIRDHKIEILSRTHISKPGVEKVRPVYNVPMAYLVIEKMVLHPLLAQARTSPTFAYGYETQRGGTKRLHHELSKYKRILTFDFKSFDQTIPFWLIDEIHNWLFKYMDCSKGYTPITNYTAQTHSNTYTQRNDNSLTIKDKMTNLWNFMNRMFKEFRFVDPYGNVYIRKYAGLPSGCLQTQFMDSLCNQFIIIFILIKCGISTSDILSGRIITLGDDSIVGIDITEYEFDLIQAKFGTILKDVFNMTINPKITHPPSINTAQFLGYTSKNGYPTPNLPKLIAQSIYPERKSDVFKNISRSIGLAYASAATSQQFYDYCKDVHTYYYNKARKLYSEATIEEKVIKVLRKSWLYTFNVVLPSYFPSFSEIRDSVTTIQGDLPLDPFWSSDYFLEPPFIS